MGSKTDCMCDHRYEIVAIGWSDKKQMDYMNLITALFVPAGFVIYCSASFPAILSQEKFFTDKRLSRREISFR